MKILILDEATWRCGTGEDEIIDNKTSRGLGPTRLLNNKGFRCCLGQFAPQLNENVKDKDLINVGKPSGTLKHIPILTEFTGENTIENSLITMRAININDDPYTTIQYKVEKLKQLFSEANCKIIFKRRKSWLRKLIDKIYQKFFSNTSSN